jgi:prepilin-type N-terminal cleavage/methylation domain-containing protein
VSAAGRLRRQAGFSLFELVLAMAIAGVLLVLAFTGGGLLASRRLAGAARTLAGDMRVLEQRARAERTCYRIIFDPVGNTYTVHRYDGVVTPAASGGGSQCTDAAAWTTIPYLRERPGDTVSRRMPSGVDLVSTSFLLDTMVVSPLGNANAGTVTLRTSSGQDRYVVVEVMGRVRILQ